MPGDAAFKLECDFSAPSDVNVSADMLSGHSVLSRMSLTDADPSSKQDDTNERFTVENRADTVIITPEIVQPRRKVEL
ncbi:hypothetical protein NQ318_019865 [Aromia moschata]|uniref:Uncharacterized protein n=1 Tax=Aromia moschata TaxID=1265417 RepID=A0AAV8YLU9_9CUCU|nr:hypothetical protein NQ318_019865 [Aromia moschata]